MAWETRNGKGRYYTRTRREGGRVVREYVGTGPAAEAAAALDERRRAGRRAQAEARKAEEASWRDAEAPLRQLEVVTKVLMAAALIVAGFRQHDRGAWRRRREGRREEGQGRAGPRGRDPGAGAAGA
jgi:hypothetical protein